MINKYSYKGYFTGFGMSGLGDMPVAGHPPIIYTAVPKEAKLASILEDVNDPENVPHIWKIKFRLVAMIPVYELYDMD